MAYKTLLTIATNPETATKTLAADTIDEALRVAMGRPAHIAGQPVDIAANYTAFQEYFERIGATS